MTNEEVWQQILTDVEEKIEKLSNHFGPSDWPEYSEALVIYRQHRTLVRRRFSALEARQQGVDPLVWKLSVND